MVGWGGSIIESMMGGGRGSSPLQQSPQAYNVFFHGLFLEHYFTRFGRKTVLLHKMWDSSSSAVRFIFKLWGYLRDMYLPPYRISSQLELIIFFCGECSTYHRDIQSSVGFRTLPACFRGGGVSFGTTANFERNFSWPHSPPPWLPIWSLS